MTDQPNYKDTLNLPKTSFPMKASLPQREPEFIKKWNNEDIYEQMISTNNDKGRFVMPDGPPYANGNIHVGHVLNKVLKDIVIKYKNMSGYSAAFIPGWDCHGLPIELKVTKKLGSKRKEMTDKQVRDLCRKEAHTWVNKQKEQFVRLGIVADWENPYLTLHPEYEAAEVRVLAKILDNGILYRGEKPVNWCPALQTALAAAEVEYHDHKSPSVYVKFEAKDHLDKVSPNGKKTSYVIWTTTPWTLPANYGICLNANLEYGVYETGDENIILAKELKDSVAEACELELKELTTFKGSELDRATASHPFMDRESLVMLGDHVTLEAGTGCVHTAPGHGLDDYHVGLKYDLPVVSPVDPAGRYTNDYAEMEGVKIWDANPKIVEKLKDSGHLIGFTEIIHSYPHNPRSKTPLIFRATPQWFIKMDDENYPLRKKALECAEKEIDFVPKWGQQRLDSMLTNSPDWCLSRQRTWGVPIPVFYCNSCGEALVNSSIMNKVADVMEEKGTGIEAYHDEPIETFVSGHKCSCGSTDFKPGQDILDVWFDSGVCHTAVQKQRDELDTPADIYLEGSDQHRGWFQTSLLSSLAAYGEAPFKALITHGFVNDSQGHKMSKSKGNTIDPADVIKQYGAEILRLWVAYEDYGQDVNISNEMFKRVSETYRRIRNTMRFLLGNLDDFDYSTQKVDFKDLTPLDQWALIRLNQLIGKVNKAYESYDFYKVYHALNAFFTVDLSSIYLDILKDRLYTSRKDGTVRRGSQTVLYELLDNLIRMMAPILSFLAEETYNYLPKNQKESTIFKESFPSVNSQWKNDELVTDFEILLEIRSTVSKELEELRRNKEIGSSLDAKVILTVDSKTKAIVDKYAAEMVEFLIVSQLEVVEGDSLKVEPMKADGEKCDRCWHYSVDTGANPSYPNACPKCVEALK